MKRVVSVSLGSSRRNNTGCLSLMGEDFSIERIGTDGDMEKMIELIEALDGQVDAFGLGGMDLYISAGKKRYVLRDARKIVSAAKVTPIVDGSGLKNTLERQVIQQLSEQTDLFENGKKVLLVSAMDRFGMAEAFEEMECRMTYGDLPFILGVPLPLHSLRTLYLVARLLVPIVRLLPFQLLYPTGSKQDEIKTRFPRLYREADIIAGDFHFIRRYMPETLRGKVIITNTVTAEDVELLRARGVRMLVTTTPEIGGRSFGTNVMEALLVAVSGKKEELSAEDYDALLCQVDFQPRIEFLEPGDREGM